jgi:acetylornithine deacetylase/succinyl-diaminopimelate desuccinylase-like protein
LEELIASVENVIREMSRPGLSLEAEVIGSRPAGEMSPNHPLIQLAEECVRTQGLEPVLTSGSTDANIPLSKGYPALVLGVTTGGGAHTKDEFIHTGPVAKGMEQLLMFVKRCIERS